MKSRGEWAEFFPPNLSPHYYHESPSFQYFADLDPELARMRGYRVEEQPSTATSTMHGIPASTLPDQLLEADLDRLAGQAVICARTKLTFNLQKKELEFYQRFSLPLPSEHWRFRLRAIAARQQRIEVVRA